jgi:tetratricopeptide (TPR) repeat protein
VRLRADVLKARRHQLGLSQEAFALACFERQLCVSIASVKRAETGKPLLWRTARHLALFHGLDLESLVLTSSAPDLAADLAHDASPDATHLARQAATDEAFIQKRDLHLITASGGAPPRWPSHDGRLVHVLYICPVRERERADCEAAMAAAGATVMPAPHADAMLAVFGLPRAQRSDLGRCHEAAMAWRERHVMVSGGMWLDEVLTWPQDIATGWLPRQPCGIHVHRSMFGQWRALHHVEALDHPDMGRLGEALKLSQRPFKLAGRQHEMRVFGGLLEAVLADQQSQVMLVQSMAGMGKTRLLAEMMDAARQQFMSAVQVDIQDFGSDRSRHVIVRLLHGLLDLPLSTPFWDQLVLQRLQPFRLPAEQMLVCKDLLGMQMSLHERQTLLSVGHVASAQVMAHLLARIIGRMALQRPLLLVIEDLHWASGNTVEILARLIMATQESQIMWVLSSRIEAPARAGELQRLITDVPMAIVGLVPLKPHELRDLARQFEQVDEAWRVQCMQRAQGHPLFLTLLLMAGQRTPLPDNFQHLLQERLDDVAAQDRHAVRLLAVLGQACSLQDLRALLGDAGYQIGPLVQQCLLRQLDDDRYDFLHALIRQGVYEALPPTQREAMHAQVARLFEGRDHALHAQHLHLARHPDAPTALLAAARDRQSQFDHEGALALLHRHAEVDYAPQDAHAHAMLLGHVWRRMGSLVQSRQAFEQACAQAHDGPSSLQAKVALAQVLDEMEALQAEEALIDAALVQARAEAALGPLATLHGLKGNLFLSRGDAVRSRVHHSKAMDIASLLGDAALQAQAHSGLGDSYHAEGLLVTANEHVERCLQLAVSHGLREVEAANRCMLAVTQLYGCQTESALVHAQACAELAQRVGHRRAEIQSRLTASWVLLGQGKARDALNHIDEGLLVSRTMGSMRFEPLLLEAQARAMWALGDEVSAQRIIAAALDGVERLQLHAFIGPWVMGTWALLHAGDGQAQPMLRRAERQIREGCLAHNVYRYYVSAMELHTLAGRHEAATQAGQAWLQRTRQEPMPWVQALHDFLTACANPQAMPTPQHPAWAALRERQILHVLLKLPRALLASPPPVRDTSTSQLT